MTEEPFTVIAYDLSADKRVWRNLTRSTLMDEIVRAALIWSRTVGMSSMSKDEAHVHLRRIANDRLTPWELQAVLDAWASFWAANKDSVVFGCTYQNGRFVPA